MGRYHEGELFTDLPFHTAYRKCPRFSSCLHGWTVVWLLRHMGCPICQLDIHQIEEKYDELEKSGIQVFVVLQSSSDSVRKSLEQHPLPFEIICDEEEQFYRELGVQPAVSEKEFLGTDRETADRKLRKAGELGFVHRRQEGQKLQLPAVFAVDQDRTILYAHYAKTVTDLPSVEQIMEIIMR